MYGKGVWERGGSGKEVILMSESTHIKGLVKFMTEDGARIVECFNLWRSVVTTKPARLP